MMPPGEGRDRLLLAASGFNLVLVNYTLLRQATLAFRDLETSALLMALAYFTGVSVGYAGGGRVDPRLVRRLLPLVLGVQAALIALTQLLADVVRASAGTAVAYLAVFGLVALGATSLYSVFLPALVGAAPDRTRRYYSWEIAGSLAALAALPLLSLGGMRPLLGAYFASFVAIAALIGLRGAGLALLALACVGFTATFDAIDREVATRVYRRHYAGRGVADVVFTRWSPYHRIDVVALERRGPALLLNGQWQFGPASHDGYSYFVAEYPSRLLRAPTVAVLGCGSMSTVGRIGTHAASITIVDLDTAVFETSRRFFGAFNRLGELGNWTFVSDDAKHFLGTTRERFDLVVDDIPPARTRQLALTYTREFFGLVRARLAARGLFSLPSLVPVGARSGYGRRILATLADVFDQVAVLDDGRRSYFLATSRDTAFTREGLRDAIAHPDRPRMRILMPDEVRALVRDERVVTVGNMADLIDE